MKRLASRWISPLVCGLALLWFSPPARAQRDPPTVVLVVESRSDPVVTRLRAELAALGFAARLSTGTRPGESLSSLARRTGAVAAVRIADAAHGLDVWVADRITGKTLIREVVIPEGESGRAEAIIALRAVELLRASLMEIHASQTLRGDVEVPEEIRDRVRPAPDYGRRTLSLALGPALSISPGSIGPAFQSAVDIRWSPTSHLMMQVFGLLPLRSPRLEEAEGRAEIEPWSVGLGGILTLTDPASAFRPAVGAGGMISWLIMDGSGSSPYTGQRDRVVTLMPYLRAELALRISSWLRLRAEVLGAFGMPRAVVQFDKREVATWGRPLIVPSLSLEVGLF